MSVVEGLGTLRPTIRRDLLDHLDRLKSRDPARRASAALAVTRIVNERGLNWDSLIVAAERSAGDGPSGAWPAPALHLADHPAVSSDDRAALRRLAKWRAPGVRGLAQLREIAEKAGVEVD